MMNLGPWGRGGESHVLRKGGGRAQYHYQVKAILLATLFTISSSCNRVVLTTDLTELTIITTKDANGAKRIELRCRSTKITWLKLDVLKLQLFDFDSGSYIDLVISSEQTQKNMPSRTIWANIKSGFFAEGGAKYEMNPLKSHGQDRELLVGVPQGYSSPVTQYRCTALGVDNYGIERIDHSPRAFVRGDN